MPDPSRPGVGGSDDRADSALYRREAPRLRRYFHARVGRSDEVGDLVQEAFTRLAGRRLPGPLKNPAAYLQRIARNLLVDRSRRHAAAPPFVDVGNDGLPEVAVAPDQGCDLEAEQMMTAYERAVEALPPRTREVFLLHRLGELSYQEIADRLAISPRTVEWHIAEALLRIRRALDGG